MRGGLPRNASLPSCLGGGRGRGTPSPSASSPSSPGPAYEDGHSPFAVDTPGLVAKEVLIPLRDYKKLIPITRPVRGQILEVAGRSTAASECFQCMLCSQP